MKKIIAFLLMATLILTMGVPSFALKGGDSDEFENMLFNFTSTVRANSLIGSDRFYGLTVDENITAPGSTASVKLTSAGKTAIVNGAQSPISDWDNAISDWSEFDGIKLNLYVSEKNTETTFAGQTVRIILGAHGVYNDSSDGNNNKDYWRYDLNIANLDTGWNAVEVPFTSFNSVINGSAVSNKSFNDYKHEYPINSFTIINGTEGTFASASVPFPWELNLDSVLLTKAPVTYSYAVTSDAAVLWEFNTPEKVSTAASLNAAATSGSPSMTVDKSFVNAYDMSATFTTSSKRRMQIKLDPNNIIQSKDENGAFVYDYINFLIGNPQDTDVIFGYGYYGKDQAVTLPANSWSLLSVKIDELFWNGNSQNGRTATKYADLSGVAFQMNDFAGGNNNAETTGIKYNFDMIWISKAPAAVGTADEKGTILSQLPLSYTDAKVTDNGDGTAYASAKISNWPGERFVVIFASYTADNALHAVTLLKDYDGAQNSEQLVETSSIEISEGGRYKIMVWNGFGDILPMAPSTK